MPRSRTVASANRFSPETLPSLGHYVYALIDPRKRGADVRRIFYVGKGVGPRCFSHARAATKRRRKHDEPNPKLQLIRKIRRTTGAAPPIQILCHGLTNPEAGRIEAVLIKTLATDGNLCAGAYGDNYCLTVDEVEGRYSKPLRQSDLRGCILLVSLNGGDKMKPFGQIAEAQLARRTLRYWRIGEAKAVRVDFVMGVYNQLVRTVFRTTKREGKTLFRRHNRGLMKNGRTNWKTGFLGRRDLALETEWCNRRIVDSKGRTLTKFDWPQTWKLVS